MTVAELIKLLEALPQESKVFYDGHDDRADDCEVTTAILMDNQNPPIVVIM